MVLFGACVTLLVCGAVTVLGRAPERTAALLVLAGLAASLALQAALGFRRPLPILVTDLGLTAGFIVLSHRHRRAWLGVICLILIALLVVHASLAEAPFPTAAFGVAVNGLDFAALATLAAGAVMEARRRQPRPRTAEPSTRATLTEPHR